MTYYGLFTPEQMLAQSLLIMHIIYFWKLFYSIYVAKLFRITPRYKTINGREHTYMLYKIDIKPDKACESISEFSNIRGTISHLGLLIVGIMTFCFYFAIFLFRMPIWLQSTRQTLGAIFSFCAGVGLTTLGLFDVNPDDVKHKIVHYMGFGIAFFAIAGLGFETNFDIYFWVPFTVIICGLSAWLFFIIKATRTLPSNDPEYVNKISKQCLFCQCVVFVACAFSLDLYLYLLNDYQ